MAEKATSAHTCTLTLTYAANGDGTDPDGAHAFKYKDIQVWLNSLRQAAIRAYPEVKTRVRYLVAGETGSKFKRVHWHVVLFANIDLSTLGEYTDLAGTRESQRMGRRQRWTLWPHGLVQFDPADRASLAYVLKYILKDQFTNRKSAGTAREGKGDVYGASFFRMSKQPPIGTDYIVEKIRAWRAKGYVPVTTTLQIPDYRGYWWPVGQLRVLMMSAIWAINAEYKHKTGRNMPQWAALLASVERLNQGQEVKDYETLQFGVMSDGETYDDQIETGDLERKRENSERMARARALRAKCGGPRICAGCYRGKSLQERSAVRAYQAAAKARYAKSGSYLSFESWYRQQNRQGNPHCILRGFHGWKDAFPS